MDTDVDLRCGSLMQYKVLGTSGGLVTEILFAGSDFCLNWALWHFGLSRIFSLEEMI